MHELSTLNTQYVAGASPLSGTLADEAFLAGAAFGFLSACFINEARKRYHKPCVGYQEWGLCTFVTGAQFAGVALLWEMGRYYLS